MRSAALVLLVALSACQAGAGPEQIHLGSDGPLETSVTVSWRSEDPEGEVQYGTTKRYGSRAIAASSEYGGSWLHHARLEGLEPGTRYRYRCGRDGAWSEDHVFATPARSLTRYRFAVYGDSRSDDSARDRVRAAVQAARPAFSVHTGDYVGNGAEQDQWDEWFRTMEPLLAESPLFGAIGNHEGHSSLYYDQFAFPRHGPDAPRAPGEAWYSFDYGTTHVVVLSTEHQPARGDAQYRWLLEDLARAARHPEIRWTIAVGHRPPWSSGHHGSDLEVRAAWSAAFESFGVDVTFWGHDHDYERSRPIFQGRTVPSGGVVHVVTGGAGAPLYPVTPGPATAASREEHHYVEVSVDGETMTLEARDVEGRAFDRLVLKKPGPKPAWVMDGVLDPAARRLSGEEGAGLAAGWDGRWLYVAGEGPSARRDRYLLVAIEEPKALVPAPGGKAGRTWRSAVHLAAGASTGSSAWRFSGEEPVLPFGAAWKYLDDGTDPGRGWTALGYDDRAWKTGRAHLGYGDGDERTVLEKKDPPLPSAYFRTTFELAGVPEEVTLRVVHDDGVAVWVNGEQVLSQGIRSGAGHDDWASRVSSDNQLAEAALPPGCLVRGENVVAAVVKQAGPDSSDLSFDLALEVPGRGPAGTFASDPAGPVVEGALDLEALFGRVPEVVYLALASYEPGSGGALAEELPPGDGDGDLALGEWAAYEIDRRRER